VTSIRTEYVLLRVYAFGVEERRELDRAMINIDIVELVRGHRQDLLAEAKRERLAAQLARAETRMDAARRGLALACFRIAAWLDGPFRYVRRTESGDEDWVAPWAGV
jgi:hypothetical protein